MRLSTASVRKLLVFLSMTWAFGLFSLAHAQDLTKLYNGKIIISAETFPAKQDEEMAKFLKEKSTKDSVYSSTCNEKNVWTINFLAFLNKDTGGADLSLVFYDKDNKEAQKKLEPTQSVDISSVKGQRILKMSALALSDSAGFVAGKTYIVRVTQLKGGKEITLSSALLKLEAPTPAKETPSPAK